MRPTDTQHTLLKIRYGVTAAEVSEIEQELANTVDTPAETAAEYYPVVAPVLHFFANSLPVDSNWKKALSNYIALADAEAAGDPSAKKTAKTNGKK